MRAGELRVQRLAGFGSRSKPAGRAPRNRLDDIRPIDRLPARSREVAQLLCKGHPNKAIAARLGISVYTVKEHVQNLCKRFGALNRTDLVHRLLIDS